MMPTPRFARLQDRGVVSVSGPDAAKLLQGLITNDMDRLDEVPAMHAALLTPQGKILFTFFVVRHGSGFLLETTAAAAPELAKRVTFYRLRAKAEVKDLAGAYAVVAAWPNGARTPGDPDLIAYSDTRHPDIGLRILIPAHTGSAAATGLDGATATPADYAAHRIACGVAEFGTDYAAAEVFPHEANLDRQAGVDFRKGCFVGQEVVSRMQHKTVVRKRFVRVSADADLPMDHPEITAGPATVGTLASVAGHDGLALLRLDRVIEQMDAGNPVLAAGTPLEVGPDELAAFRRMSEARKPDTAS